MGKEWTAYYRKSRWHGKKPAWWVPQGKFSFKLLTKHVVYVIRGMPYRGLQVAEWWSASHGVTRPLGKSVNRLEMTNVKKVKLKDRASVKHVAALETEFFRELLPIVEQLALLQYEDGTPRQTGYLGVWCVGTTWTVRVTDKDADAQLTAEGRTLDEALSMLAMYLGTDEAPWEPCKGRKKGK